VADFRLVFSLIGCFISQWLLVMWASIFTSFSLSLVTAIRFSFISGAMEALIGLLNSGFIHKNRVMNGRWFSPSQRKRNLMLQQ
jgi:hypothetical protein